ncbi:murein hydrolase activator EnvC family protein [Palleronia sediminis]|nr:peptidase M23 [Palleronia sediminis]
MKLWRAILLGAALAAPGMLWAQADPGTLARDAAERLRIASEDLAQAEGARDRVAALTRTIRAYEEGLGALREGLRRARTREAEIGRRLDGESARIGALLSGLRSIVSAPEATLMLHPDGPEDTVRAAMLMRDLTPALVAELDAVKADLSEIATLRDVQETAEADLRDGLAAAREARTRLSQAISNRTDLPRRVTEDRAAMRMLAENAATLRDFAEGLGDLPPDELSAGQPDFEEARGNLAWPVAGSLRRGFGDSDGAGIERPGWVIETRPGALVTTPWPATIRYAGPLLDYRNVMVLEPSEGYLLVLGGLETVYGDAGLVVPAGAPVGVMPGGSDAAMAGFMADDSSGVEAALAEALAPTLYIEVRRDKVPQDPSGWFRQQQG